MAKSTRSKVKRSFRRDKRTVGVYAATEAARLNRLNAKLLNTATADKDGDIPIGEEADGEASPDAAETPSVVPENAADAMETDGPAAPKVEKPISTHGPRNSRRDAWRASKGMITRPAMTAINRQGIPTGKRKAGRSKRRR